MSTDLADCPLHTYSYFSLLTVCRQGQLLCGLDCDFKWSKCLAAPFAANLLHREAIQNAQGNTLHWKNTLISEYKRNMLVSETWPSRSCGFLHTQRNPCNSSRNAASFGNNPASTQTMAWAGASLETYLKSSVSLGQPCRQADSAPGSSWTAGRPRTPTPRLWTNRQGMRLCTWLSGTHTLFVRIPPPFPSCLSGHSNFFRTIQDEPRTLETRPKKNTIMWENVEVIITYSCWEMGFYLLNIEERWTMFKKEKNSIFAHRIPPIFFLPPKQRRGVILCFNLSSKDGSKTRTVSVPGKQSREDAGPSETEILRTEPPKIC